MKKAEQFTLVETGTIHVGLTEAMVLLTPAGIFDK
jgi:hypothetical protein